MRKAFPEELGSLFHGGRGHLLSITSSRLNKHEPCKKQGNVTSSLNAVILWPRAELLSAQPELQLSRLLGARSVLPLTRPASPKPALHPPAPGGLPACLSQGHLACPGRGGGGEPGAVLFLATVPSHQTSAKPGGFAPALRSRQMRDLLGKLEWGGRWLPSPARCPRGGGCLAPSPGGGRGGGPAGGAALPAVTSQGAEGRRAGSAPSPPPPGARSALRRCSCRVQWCGLPKVHPLLRGSAGVRGARAGPCSWGRRRPCCWPCCWRGSGARRVAC